MKEFFPKILRPSQAATNNFRGIDGNGPEKKCRNADAESDNGNTREHRDYRRGEKSKRADTQRHTETIHALNRFREESGCDQQQQQPEDESSAPVQ